MFGFNLRQAQGLYRNVAWGLSRHQGPAEYAFGCLREPALCHSACKFWKPIDTLKRRVSVWLEANAGSTNISASGDQGNDGRIVEYQERRNERARELEDFASAAANRASPTSRLRYMLPKQFGTPDLRRKS
jgi:hypothetical protein